MRTVKLPDRSGLGRVCGKGRARERKARRLRSFLLLPSRHCRRGRDQFRAFPVIPEFPGGCGEMELVLGAPASAEALAVGFEDAFVVGGEHLTFMRCLRLSTLASVVAISRARPRTCWWTRRALPSRLVGRTPFLERASSTVCLPGRSSGANRACRRRIPARRSCASMSSSGCRRGRGIHRLPDRTGLGGREGAIPARSCRSPEQA